jgi:hypothetical protein
VTRNTSITFCLSFSRRTYTIQSLSLLKRLFACTPRTTSLLLWAPPTCRLTASHVREPSLSPAAACSSPQQSRATRSATTASKPHDTSPLSFPDSAERCHLQHNFNISNHSSSHKRSHITNLFSPCPRVSGTTPKTYRSWSRKRIALRALGTLNVTLSLPRNCANRRRSNCLWYEERLPLQTIKITCRISSAKSSTAL